MLSEADRNKAADILMEAHKTNASRRRSFRTTYPGITIEDAYAISTDRAQAPDRGGAQADRPQGGPHLEGDAALVQDRRAGLRLSARRHDHRRRRQGAARRLLPAAGRGRARLRARQEADGAGRRPDRRAGARPTTSCRRSRSSMRGCRTRARFSTPWPTTAPPPASSWAAGRCGRWMSICAGSAASCMSIRRSRRPASRPACSAIRRWAWRGLPTSSARWARRWSRAISCWPARSPAWCSPRRATRCMAISARSAGISVQFV